MTATSEDLATQVHGYGLAAARPAAGRAGREYWATDTTTLYRDNGTTWDTVFTSSGGGGSTPPVVLAIGRLTAYRNLR